ncbi:hypothetical protein FVEN_g9445 [Fusarium venenatum]|uniref:CBM-cenC domain-containing protein n=1 Tax=Fusarium venenatum TaxID=56646 RepID=A0A2L2T1W4_9HYPO|nr:uncharacterized protein FVRRES_05899 [Fusarium venenatum]KAG8352549.1 hypothetical protein FVEN_g9445 [Fusarium venenatum]KAH6992934.1 hypothetical protein EDB82DRAFT_165093 [Fusarium venenatum]CEI61463.1 unnamed protein product [Fusarium venenatum]
MIFHKLLTAVAVVTLAGNIEASPCKPVSGSSTIHMETSTTEMVTTEGIPTPIEVLSSATTIIPITASTSEAPISSVTLTPGASTFFDEATTLVTSTVESTAFDPTTTFTESNSVTTLVTIVSSMTEVPITTAYVTTELPATETATSSSPPQCTFTGEYINYVQNPSFDNKVSGKWVTTSPWVFLQTPWLSPNSGRGGSNAIAIKYPDGAWSSSILQSLQGVVAGREYVLRYYWSLQGQPLQSDDCRIGTSAGPLGQTMHFVYTDGGETIQQGQYYMQEFHITAGQDDQNLSIGFFCRAGYSGDTVTVYIDDVSVYDYYEGCDSPTEAVIKNTR